MPRLSAVLVLMAAGLAVSAAGAATAPLGVVFKDEEVSLKLAFTNSRKEKISLAAAKVSCDCLSPWFAPVAVAPGETVALPFTYLAHRPGHIAVTVEFQDAAGVVRQTTSVRGFVAERAWLVSPAQLHAANAAGAIAVVDFRSAERFAAAHLARASNLLPFAVKARADLRAKKVVLVDDGFTPDLLLEQVMTLRELGFKDVAALEGGVPAWMRAGFAVEGTSDSALPLATISAADFTRASSTAEWKIVEIASEPSPDTRTGAAVVKNWSAAADALASNQAPAKNRLAPAILVLASDVATYARIERRLTAAPAGAVFYLAGGRPALDTERTTQAALAFSTHETLQTQPGIRSRPVTSGGCSTCPK